MSRMFNPQLKICLGSFLDFNNIEKAFSTRLFLSSPKTLTVTWFYRQPMKVLQVHTENQPRAGLHRIAKKHHCRTLELGTSFLPSLKNICTSSIYEYDKDLISIIYRELLKLLLPETRLSLTIPVTKHLEMPHVLIEVCS